MSQYVVIMVMEAKKKQCIRALRLEMAKRYLALLKISNLSLKG